MVKTDLMKTKQNNVNRKFALYCPEFIANEVLSCRGPSVSTGLRVASFL